MRRLSIPQEEKIIWPALLIARAITSGTSAGYVVFHRRDIGVSQVVLHSLHSLEQPWKTCCMKDAMNHQENGLVWNCSSFLATYCPLLFHVWHRLLGWAPGAHPVPFPHISLPPSNTAHPEQRKNINFIWRKKKKGAALPQNSLSMTLLPAVGLPVSSGLNALQSSPSNKWLQREHSSALWMAATTSDTHLISALRCLVLLHIIFSSFWQWK